MPRTTANFSISVPPKMVREIEMLCRTEHRTRSELIREALRLYLREAEMRSFQMRLARLPEAEPTAEEAAAIRAGLADFRRGGFRPLEPDRDVQRPTRQPRRKSA
jgi:Arc/MetJ-type ribon-helix-helix transcriptional regulator